MTQITLNIDDNLLDQLYNLRHTNPAETQKLLGQALRTAEVSDPRLNYVLGLCISYESFAPREERSWAEFLRDVFVEKLAEYDLDFDEPYNVVTTLLEQYTADGSYTYNTRRSIDLISDFWQDFNDPDYEMAQLYSSWLNPHTQNPDGLFNRAELFLVHMMVTDGTTLLTNILDDEELKKEYVDGAWTSEALTKCLVDMDAIDLNNYLYD